MCRHYFTVQNGIYLISHRGISPLTTKYMEFTDLLSYQELALHVLYSMFSSYLFSRLS